MDDSWDSPLYTHTLSFLWIVSLVSAQAGVFTIVIGSSGDEALCSWSSGISQRQLELRDADKTSCYEAPSCIFRTRALLIPNSVQSPLLLPAFFTLPPPCAGTCHHRRIKTKPQTSWLLGWWWWFYCKKIIIVLFFFNPHNSVILKTLLLFVFLVLVHTNTKS